MPVFSVSASGHAPVLHDPQGLRTALRALPPGAPVIVLVHGLRYAPGAKGADPHRQLLAAQPEEGWPDAWAWPKSLGLGQRTLPDEGGIAISFGWEARRNLWSAKAEAGRAAAALARLIGIIRQQHAGPVDIIGHSLGAKVALAASAYCRRGDLGRLILLAAAAFRDDAEAFLASPAGAAAEVFNITSRENDLFDFVLEVADLFRGGPALGMGIGRSAANWLDVEIDNSETRHGLSILGFAVPAPDHAICHWSGYIRPGLFPFYAALLRHRAQLPMGLLRSLMPEEQRPRFARLRPRRPTPAALPSTQVAG